MGNDAATSTPSVGYRYRRHGPALSLYLGLLLIRSLVTIGIYLSVWDRLAIRIPPEELQVLGTVLILRPLCLAAIWFWSRLGVLAYIAVTATYLTLDSMLLPTSTYSIFGMLTPFVLILLVRGEWKFMRWGISLRSKRVIDDGLDD